MLPVWIVYACNFDLNIPECHITDSSLSLYIFNTVSQHETISESISICITDPYSCVCANYVPLCVCVLAHVCVCVRVYIRCVYIRTCEFKYPIEYVKIYRSCGTFDTHSSLVIFDEHLVW